MAGKKKSFVTSLSFDSLLLLRQWKPLYNAIRTSLKQPYEKTDDNNDDIPELNLLSQQNITDAFNGRYSMFFRQCCQQYQLTAQLKMLHHFEEDDGLKLTKDSKAVFDQLSTELRTISTAKLDKIIHALGELVDSHFEVWQKLLADSYESLINAAKALDVPVADSDIEELNIADTRSGLHHRLVSMKLKPFDETTILNVSDYCQHRLKILIHIFRRSPAVWR